MTKTNILIIINTHIEKRQDDALKAISTERVQRAEHIRRAIDEYLQKPEHAAALEQQPNDQTV